MQNVGQSVIGAKLTQVGNGARGIVVVYRKGTSGHVFNVINIDSEVLAVDVQRRMSMPFDAYVELFGYDEFYFLFTGR